MSAIALLDELRELDVELSLRQGRLRLNAPSGVLDDALKRRIRAHKPALLDLLDPAPARAPLTASQRRFWFLSRLSPDSPAFTMAHAVELHGELNSAALEQALNDLRRRHPTLASHFPQQDGEPWQCPDPRPLTLEREAPVDSDEALQQRAGALLRRVVELERGPLMRATLVPLRDDRQRHALVLNIHHIVFDGHSFELLCTDLAAAYQRRCELGAGYEEPAADGYSYANYAYTQQRQRAGDGAQQRQLLDWWRQRFTPLPQTVDLPADHRRPTLQSLRGEQLEFGLPGALRQGLTDFAASRGATPLMVGLSLFALLLRRYTGAPELVIGVPASLRDRVELESLVGNFINTLALRIELCREDGGALDFETLLAQVRQQVLDAYAHRELPFEQLVSALALAHDTSRPPLVQFMFDLQRQGSAQLELPGLTATPLALHRGSASHDLNLLMVEQGDGLACCFEYNTALFERERIERMAGHLRQLAESALADPQAPLSGLDMLTGGERHRLLRAWNATAQDYDHDRCLHTLFDAQARRSSHATALIDGERRVSYAQLQAASDELAARLQRHGVAADQPVGIYLRRDWRMVVAVLATLKAGGAYVALDPAYPARRLSHILDHAQPAVVLTGADLRTQLPRCGAALVELGVELGVEIGVAGQAPGTAAAMELRATPVQADTLAYVTYTSGSTGRPKGVAVSHRNVTALLHWATVQVSDAELRGVLFSTSLCFDLSVYELFVPLTRGGCVIIADNALALATLPARGQVSLLNTVPSAAAELLELGAIPDAVRVINLCGEPLRPALVDRLYAQTAAERVYDLYGPCEDTVYSTCCLRRPGAPARIGQPIANGRCYVLDQDGQPLPVGVPGELYLAGAGVARGYLHRPRLSARRFPPDPFHSVGDEGSGPGQKSGPRMYRSGDRVQYHADGSLEFLGRIDHQLKLRGFRVEPGEVGTVLEAHPAVAEALVTLPADATGRPLLVAYLRAEGEPPAPAELRHWVAERLPDYMVPARYLTLDDFPRTPNGKIDRGALPAPGDDRAAPRRQARNRLEAHLIKLWEELLESGPIGIDDSFFDHGGHSLLATRLIDRVHRHFGHRLPLDTLWVQQPTVAAMARLLGEHAEQAWPALIEIKRGAERAPLFCVHTEGGNLYHYFPLARALHPDQPVFGLQALGAYALQGLARREVHHCLRAMAAHCITTLRGHRADGPCALAGFSSGGLIAFETARALVAAGQPPAALFLIDSYAPGTLPRRDLRTRVGELFKPELRNYHRERLRFHTRRALRLGPPRDFPSAAAAHRWAQWSYRPRPYDGPVTLFLSADSRRSHADQALGWSRLCPRLQVEHLPGRHATLIGDPGDTGSGLAALLQQRLDALPPDPAKETLPSC